MELDWIWKTILIVIIGTFLLRIAGRKSISQMTIAETIIMISIGTVLVQPVSNKNIWITFGVGAILILTLIVMEYAQIKGDGFEKLITGKSKVIIENGRLNEKNLMKLRLTVDQLEMKLRQKNVTKISDVQWATLEQNGQVGYVLKDEKQPVTKKEFEQLTLQLQGILNQVQAINQTNQPLPNQQTIFSEVSGEGHEDTPPERLL